MRKMGSFLGAISQASPLPNEFVLFVELAPLRINELWTTTAWLLCWYATETLGLSWQPRGDVWPLSGSAAFIVIFSNDMCTTCQSVRNSLIG